jgi:hypothetical protein
MKGRSTSSEEAPEYFGAKRRLSLKNENIMSDRMIGCFIKGSVTMKEIQMFQVSFLQVKEQPPFLKNFI